MPHCFLILINIIHVFLLSGRFNLLYELFVYLQPGCCSSWKGMYLWNVLISICMHPIQLDIIYPPLSKFAASMAVPPYDTCFALCTVTWEQLFFAERVEALSVAGWTHCSNTLILAKTNLKNTNRTRLASNPISYFGYFHRVQIGTVLALLALWILLQFRATL